MKRDYPIEPTVALIYSISVDRRNYLRSLTLECGVNAVCFENEAVCFDNFKPIQPKIVIADTDSNAVVWRFLFALHAARIAVPLVIVSERLQAGQFVIEGVPLPIHSVALKGQQNGLLKKIVQSADHMAGRRADSNWTALPLLVGQTDKIKHIQSLLPGIAKTRDSVLITGEQGAGKEHLCRLIVGLSRKEKHFIKIDCAVLKPAMLINSLRKEILERGRKAGRATIFLDRIDTLSTESQAELLLISEDIQKPHNDNSSGNGKVRFLSTSIRPIDTLVQQGCFRKDLYYRLNVIPVVMPALRQRKADIAMLMDYFIIRTCAKTGNCVTVPTEQARQMCYMHHWPGNVKELQDQMIRVALEGNEACLFANTRLPQLKKELRRYPFHGSGVEALPKASEIRHYLSVIQDMSLKDICDEFVFRTERRLMKKALESTNWNRKKAAQLLKISYKSMLNKIKVYDII